MFFVQKDAAYVNLYTIPFQDNELLVSSDSGHEGHDRDARKTINIPNPMPGQHLRRNLCTQLIYTCAS